MMNLSGFWENVLNRTPSDEKHRNRRRAAEDAERESCLLFSSITAWRVVRSQQSSAILRVLPLGLL